MAYLNKFDYNEQGRINMVPADADDDDQDETESQNTTIDMMQ